jgi:chemotaxis protein histidine kinase CheA
MSINEQKQEGEIPIADGYSERDLFEWFCTDELKNTVGSITVKNGATALANLRAAILAINKPMSGKEIMKQIHEQFEDAKKSYRMVVDAYLDKRQQMKGVESKIRALVVGAESLVDRLTGCSCRNGVCATCTCSIKGGGNGVCNDNCTCKKNCCIPQGKKGGVMKAIEDDGDRAARRTKRKELERRDDIKKQRIMDKAREDRKKKEASEEEASESEEDEKPKKSKGKKKSKKEESSEEEEEKPKKKSKAKKQESEDEAEEEKPKKKSNKKSKQAKKAKAHESDEEEAEEKPKKSKGKKKSKKEESEEEEEEAEEGDSKESDDVSGA